MVKKKPKKKIWDTSITDRDLIIILNEAESSLNCYVQEYTIRSEGETELNNWLKGIIQDARSVLKDNPNDLYERMRLKEKSNNAIRLLERREEDLKKRVKKENVSIFDRDYFSKREAAQYNESEIIEARNIILTYLDILDAIFTCQSVDYPIDNAFEFLETFFKNADSSNGDDENNVMRHRKGIVQGLKGLFDSGLEGHSNMYICCDGMREELITGIGEYFDSCEKKVPTQVIELCNVVCDSTKYVLFKNDILQKIKE
tara:strand:+ start:14338 stop:15111 length:774 start_codon:yes stop_codon:yes gene_type:complete